jgi:hypothetical protein
MGRKRRRGSEPNIHRKRSMVCFESRSVTRKRGPGNVYFGRIAYLLFFTHGFSHRYCRGSSWGTQDQIDQPEEPRPTSACEA